MNENKRHGEATEYYLITPHDLRRRMIRDLDSQQIQILVIGILDHEYYIWK